MSPIPSEFEIRERLSKQIIADQPNGYVFPHHQGKPPKDASVLVILRQKSVNDWDVLLTRRTENVESHKGQVSFPGGARDAEDVDEIETALREAYEEIGVKIPKTNVLGKINTRKTISNFMVTTFVATAPDEMSINPNPFEVDRVFTVPLSWLRSEDNFQSSLHPESNQEIYRFKEYDNEVIWGVTAGILVDLIRILDSEK